jgi:hypothetical protein
LGAVKKDGWSGTEAAVAREGEGLTESRLNNPMTRAYAPRILVSSSFLIYDRANLAILEDNAISRLLKDRPTISPK